MLGERSRTQKDTPWVKVTLIWPMLSMTPSPPRSRVQISTQSRGLPTSHSLEIPTTVEVRTFIHFKTSLMKDIYPRPKPMPRPQPGSSDNSGGGGGSYPPSHDGHGSTHGGGRYRPSDHGSNYGGDGYPSYGNPQDHLAFLDSRRQQDSKNSVSYRVWVAGDPGGGNGQLFPVQQEEELLQGK
ncbi:glycoprotein Xg isoform X13 [Balaenoptera musculus]|nr:glycoprotein Xg isoform X13 [Balaenoptera musculus]